MLLIYYMEYAVLYYHNNQSGADAEMRWICRGRSHLRRCKTQAKNDDTQQGLILSTVAHDF
jgi:hypothetical protein